MEIKIQNKQNFGWHFSTHKVITSRALEGFEKLKPYESKLGIYSQIPDFDERGFLGNLHFYNRNENKSYCDSNSKNNAFVRYQQQVKQMFEAIENKNNTDCIKHTGRALHFLQDMTQPQHTQEISLFRKILDLKNHLQFEFNIKANQEKYADLYIPQEIKDKPFEDIFLENVTQSVKVELPKQKNVKDWEETGINGFHQAIDSTREFLMKINNLFN